MEDAYKILIVAVIALFPFFYHHQAEKKGQGRDEGIRQEQRIEGEEIRGRKYVAIMPQPKGEGSLEIDHQIKVAVFSFKEGREGLVSKRVLNTLNKNPRFRVLNLEFDPETYLPEIEINKLAELVIYGEVLAKSETFLAVELKAKQVNGEILCEDTLLGPRSKVYEEIEEFVTKIEDALPLLSGRVVHREKDKVVLNLGREEGLAEKRRLIVHRISGLKRGEKDQILGVAAEDVGLLEVEETFLDKSFARVLKEVEGEGQIRAGDMVRTK